MEPLEVRHHIKVRPRTVRSGEQAYVTHAKLLAKRDEIALTLGLVTSRPLFGRVYSGLQSEYFHRMPPNSGVYICPFAKTHEIFPGIFNPVDIDLLIIPYENNELVLSRTMAIEGKAIRAAFVKQGRSPNEFGFSQAKALKEIGFPYVAVAHIIVSDKSPKEAWRDIGVFRVLDDAGRCEPLPDQKVDWLPIDLMKRAFGRLRANCTHDDFGLAAIYKGSSDEDILNRNERKGYWLPDCRKALYNEFVSDAVFPNLADYFDRHPTRFLDTPRFDPE